jgi:hypothetical protein
MNVRLLLTLALLFAAAIVPALPAQAQIIDAPRNRAWQPDWERGQFDRSHVILGKVTQFAPFRLQILRTNGTVQTIDLKHGTEILPTGETPGPNMRVAIMGYYSNGTFIANRVILRD